MTLPTLSRNVALGAALAALLAWAPLAWRVAVNDEAARVADADRAALGAAQALQRRTGKAFDDLADRVAWTAATPGVADAFREFEEAFWALAETPDKGSDLLRRHFDRKAPLPAGSLYGAVFERRDPLLAAVARGIGADELLLVEPKGGRVVYGLSRDGGAGAPLAADGPAGAVAREAFKSQGGALFSGFTGTADGWLAAPIRQREDTLGALLVRIPVQRATSSLAEVAPLDPALWLGFFDADGTLLAHDGATPEGLAEGVGARFARMSGDAGSLPLDGPYGSWRGIARGLDLAGWPAVGVAAAPVAEGKGTVTLLLATGLLAALAGGGIGALLHRAVSRPLSAHINRISHLSQTGQDPTEGGFAPSGIAPLDDLVEDLGRSLAAHRAETEKERQALQAYIDQLESMARSAALSGDADDAEERKKRRRAGEERSFAEAVWPRIRAALGEAVDALKTLESPSAQRAVAVMETAAEQLSRGFAGMAGPPEIGSAAFGSVDLATLSFERAKALSGPVEEKGIEMLFEQSDGKTLVRGDAAALTRMVDALLANALAYTPPEGAITLRVEKEGEIVRLTVADTGLGIARGEEKKIFERFRRGTAAAATGVPGLGLGLSDAHAIALAHGARMVAANGPEKGALVTVEFPDGTGPRQPKLPVG